jgi:hypothetical protein
MNHIAEKHVLKRGQIFKVFCQKTGEMTLLINCHGCEYNKGYDPKLKILKCEKA